jgi:nucleoside-diphosphate-sugar epimerase
MSNVIEACKQAGSKLVFFDNVYAYGRVDGAMTESTPYNPCSKKGEIRAKIAAQLMDETKPGGLTALIARSADFYGPFADTTSVPNRLVFKPFSAGKRANWLVNDRVRHSYTFTLDIASALATLSKSNDAYNQVWHLPTAPDPLTGNEFVDKTAKGFGVDAHYRVLSKGMLRLAGLFVKTVAESYEMLYQNEFEYIFDSSKFENSFHMSPTSYGDGIRKTAEYYMTRGAA